MALVRVGDADRLLDEGFKEFSDTKIEWTKEIDVFVAFVYIEQQHWVLSIVSFGAVVKGKVVQHMRESFDDLHTLLKRVNELENNSELEEVLANGRTNCS